MIAARLAGSENKNKIVNHLTSDVKGLGDFSNATTDKLGSEVEVAASGMINNGISREAAQGFIVVVVASIIGSL